VKCLPVPRRRPSDKYSDEYFQLLNISGNENFPVMNTPENGDPAGDEYTGKSGLTGAEYTRESITNIENSRNI
jgi:hypothetical protein